jgi:hypothetical protein
MLHNPVPSATPTVDVLTKHEKGDLLICEVIRKETSVNDSAWKLNRETEFRLEFND